VVPKSDQAKEDRSAVFLAMGRDHANGRLSLHPLTQALEIEWDLRSNMHLYDAEERFARALASAMGGDPAFNPFWKVARLPVSVHNLGGCALADTPSQGVADPTGEVFNYPGLFVLDGAAIPVAIGANPSHTIAAVAERNIQAVIRKYTDKKTWQAPETPDTRPIQDPMPAVPAGGTPPLP
jgi:cholesterol oxidase